MPTKAKGPVSPHRLYFSGLDVEYMPDLDAYRITFTPSPQDGESPDNQPMTLWMSPDDLDEAAEAFEDACNVRNRVLGDSGEIEP